MYPSDKNLTDLARLIQDTECQEIDCAEVLNRVAGYLEAVRARSARSEQLRQVAQHLQVCPECLEEFQALIKAEGLDPKAVLPE
ncbi:MAG: hypothetical protein FLDDKLPJ_03652 [Phycisphaerae bacterium]|nr:hypothetical protein [Phycisphaerae bacterium]